MDLFNYVKNDGDHSAKIWSLYGWFLIYKNNCLGLRQNNLNDALLVNGKAFALHSNAACRPSLWKNQMLHRLYCTLDRDATVEQPFMKSISPTGSKLAPLINMSSLYRFSTIKQTVWLFT